MIANYHTHTTRCGHASGTEEEYIRCALDADLQILGFSDHTPYPFPKNHHSHFRMSMAAFYNYVDTVSALRKTYADQLEILMGVEAEYYPKYFKEMVSILRDQGMQYMLLGQHFLYNETEGIGSIGPTADVARLQQYCNQTIEAMQTGLYTYFAHPDLMNFVGNPKVYRNEIRRLCREANACGVPLEINLLGYREGRHYPDVRFWEVAAEENCKVILGVDAHQPHNFMHTQSLQTAEKMIARLGLQKLDSLPLRPLK